MNRDALHRTLARLAEAGEGVLTPDAVVEAAASPDSPLHGYFEWDDTEAARKYRLEQARTLIRSVHVEVQSTTHAISAVAYVRDPALSKEQQGYRHIEDVRTDEEKAAAVMWREIMATDAVVNRMEGIAQALKMDGRSLKSLRKSLDALRLDFERRYQQPPEMAVAA